MHHRDPDTRLCFDDVLGTHSPAFTCAREGVGSVAAKLLALAFLPIALTACSASRVDRDGLTARGMIDESAPVKAVVQIVIQAQPAKVWGLLTNRKDWAAWQPDISDVAIQASPAVTIPFTWSMGGMTIRSTIQLFDADRAVGSNESSERLRARSLQLSMGINLNLRNCRQWNGWK